MYGLLGQYWTEIQLFENLESEGTKKSKYLQNRLIKADWAFKVVQIKFLTMHFTYQKFKFNIYGRKCTKYLHGTWSLLIVLMIFGIKKIYNFDSYNVILAIATNIPQRLKTGFVVQGHICYYDYYYYDNDAILIGKWDKYFIICI